MTNGEGKSWTPSTAEGRWCGLGPYYAMFPVGFAREVVSSFCPEGGGVLDPFCGRGTVPFVSQATGRPSVGVDPNPVAWLYSAVKLGPASDANSIADRVDEILASVTAADCVADSEFQAWAWHSDVLGFLKSARRNLQWRSSQVDQTLMALILVHLHAKLGEGLSNQMRQSKAMAPDYSVKWWSERRMSPPAIDVAAFFRKKLAWRYHRGIPVKQAESIVLLGKSEEKLKDISQFSADLVFTSPPYFGVTNYEYDNWIRLWMLGGPSRPTHKTASRFNNMPVYKKMMSDVMREAKHLSAPQACVYMRTDARPFTLSVSIDVIRRFWPDHKLYYKADIPLGPTQTALFGNEWKKVGEVDLVAVHMSKPAPESFRVVDQPVASAVLEEGPINPNYVLNDSLLTYEAC